MFSIVNTRTGAVIASAASLLDSMREKGIGLIGAAAPRALVIHTRWGIHTFGVRFPIDAIVLDHAHIVRKIATVAPNRFLFWDPDWGTVIELPAGAAASGGVVLGDRIDFVVQ